MLDFFELTDRDDGSKVMVDPANIIMVKAVGADKQQSDIYFSVGGLLHASESYLTVKGRIRKYIREQREQFSLPLVEVTEHVPEQPMPSDEEVTVQVVEDKAVEDAEVIEDSEDEPEPSDTDDDSGTEDGEDEEAEVPVKPVKAKKKGKKKSKHSKKLRSHS